MQLNKPNLTVGEKVRVYAQDMKKILIPYATLTELFLAEKGDIIYFEDGTKAQLKIDIWCGVVDKAPNLVAPARVIVPLPPPKAGSWSNCVFNPDELTEEVEA